MYRNDPDNAQAHGFLAGVFLDQKKVPLAVKHLQERIRLKPRDFASANNLAWILAASPHSEDRDAQQAIELAEQAARLCHFREPGVLDTLAVAYAASDRFAEAIEIANQALELTTDAQMVSEIENRLKMYKEKRPYRDE